MNYLGRVLDQRFSGDFLKEALRMADKNMPYRYKKKCSHKNVDCILVMNGTKVCYFGTNQ